jgi:hypothetical protein
MSTNRAYLVSFGSAPAPHRAVGRVPRQRGRVPGRHRVGSPDLRHCRQLPGVRLRLAAPFPSTIRRPANPTALTVLLAVLLGVSMISGWLTATGAAAFAGMMAR